MKKNFIDVMNGYVMNLDEDNIFLCVCLLYSVNFFCRLANGGAKISTHGY